MRMLCLSGAAAATAILALVAGDSATNAYAADAIKIGLILTYSGPFADNARQIDNGVKLYVKQHGDTVAGRKIDRFSAATRPAPRPTSPSGSPRSW